MSRTEVKEHMSDMESKLNIIVTNYKASGMGDAHLCQSIRQNKAREASNHDSDDDDL